jgi:hypothetical protein
MDDKENGANFQIVVDGKTRPYRDTRETALEAGVFLKERQPTSEVVVRDRQSSGQIVIGWKNGSALTSDATSGLPASLSRALV